MQQTPPRPLALGGWNLDKLLYWPCRWLWLSQFWSSAIYRCHLLVIFTPFLLITLFRQHLWEHALHISPYSLSIQCILSLFSDLDIVLYCNSSSIVEVKLLPLRQQARKQFDAEFATRPLLKKMDFDNTEENYSIYKVGAFFDLGNRTPPRPLALEGWASDMLLSGIWGCYMLIFVEIVPSIGAIYVLAILTPF